MLQEPPVNLAELLADQGWAVAKESASASLYKHTPWVAPEAYLHWLFKPVTPRALEETRTLLAIRDEWPDFLSIQNGAMLYSDSLSIFGAVESGTLLNRNSPHDLGPYSLLDQKRKSAGFGDDAIIIGTYPYDGSQVVLRNNDGAVIVFSKIGSTYKTGRAWNSATRWITEELGRLKTLFDSSGKILVDRSNTLPSFVN